MPLMVARPWKHSKTGIYWLRRRVPVELLDAVGKREEKLSLKTRDATEAKRLHATAMAELESRWASLRAGPRTLSELEAHALAEPVHDWWLSKYRDEPSSQTFWRLDVGAKAFPPPKAFSLRDLAMPSLVPSKNEMQVLHLEMWCDGHAAQLMKEKGLVLDEANRKKLATAVARAVQRASETLQRLARGEVTTTTFNQPKLDEAVSQQQAGSKASTLKVGGIKLMDLFELWWTEALAVGKTRSTYISYSATMKAFSAFLKHNDADRITVEDVIGFKDLRLASVKPNGRPISPKTVRNSDLAALKSVFGWAVANRKLAINPALGVKVQNAAGVRIRDPGFTSDETKRLLKAALHVERGKEAARTHAAKRWIPWLLAFTGARVGEVAQLRTCDIRHEALAGYADGVWIMSITPEAGSVKVKKARDVPIHPQLVKQGFIQFVKASPAERLFLNPDARGGVSGPLRGLKNRLQDYARSTVNDRNVSPNHGWRHRFRSVGAEAGIEDSVIDALGGWRPPTAGRRYGEMSLKARADAIWRLPWIETD